MLTTITIDGCFNGPPGFANGGYAAGRLAAFVEGPAEVTLKAPVPIDAPLTVARDGAAVLLLDDLQEIAVAKPAEIAACTHPAVTLSQAREAARDYAGHDRGATFPTCFVCGVDRDVGEGLHIFTGPVAGSDAVASSWTPGPDLADHTGCVTEEFLWAALDCPTYFALRKHGLAALLGRMTATIHARPKARETLVVAAWPTGAEGRKHRASSAIFGQDGRLYAHADAIWIELKSGSLAPAPGTA